MGTSRTGAGLVFGSGPAAAGPRRLKVILRSRRDAPYLRNGSRPNRVQLRPRSYGPAAAGRALPARSPDTTKIMGLFSLGRHLKLTRMGSCRGATEKPTVTPICHSDQAFAAGSAHRRPKGPSRQPQLRDLIHRNSVALATRFPSRSIRSHRSRDLQRTLRKRRILKPSHSS